MSRQSIILWNNLLKSDDKYIIMTDKSDDIVTTFSKPIFNLFTNYGKVKEQFTDANILRLPFSEAEIKLFFDRLAEPTDLFASQLDTPHNIVNYIMISNYLSFDNAVDLNFKYAPDDMLITNNINYKFDDTTTLDKLVKWIIFTFDDYNEELLCRSAETILNISIENLTLKNRLYFSYKYINYPGICNKFFKVGYNTKLKYHPSHILHLPTESLYIIYEISHNMHVHICPKIIIFVENNIKYIFKLFKKCNNLADDIIAIDKFLTFTYSANNQIMRKAFLKYLQSINRDDLYEIIAKIFYEKINPSNINTSIENTDIIQEFIDKYFFRKIVGEKFRDNLCSYTNIDTTFLPALQHNTNIKVDVSELSDRPRYEIRNIHGNSYIFFRISKTSKKNIKISCIILDKKFINELSYSIIIDGTVIETVSLIDAYDFFDDRYKNQKHELHNLYIVGNSFEIKIDKA